jgi:glutathione S-transferase
VVHFGSGGTGGGNLRGFAPCSYLYTVTRWAPRVEFDLSPFPNVKAFMERMNARPKVQEALT